MKKMKKKEEIFKELEEFKNQKPNCINQIEVNYDIKLAKYYMILIAPLYIINNIEISKELYDKLNKLEE